jgi:hypothetical protein
MAALLRLPQNWNSYGAGPIQSAAVAAALRFLGQTMHPETPAPAVVPTSQGGVQLEWHAGEIDLEVRVSPSGEINVVYEDAQGEWEQEHVTDLRP